MGAKAIQLSHVNITVSDVKQAEEFYSDVLGLTVMFRHGERASFLSANEACSHEIALVQARPEVPGPGEPGKRLGLNHMAWQMGTFEDLKEVYRKLKARNAEIVQIADHHFSLGIYFRDLDGNENEVHYELPLHKYPQGENGERFSRSNPFPYQLDDDAPVESPVRELSLR